MSGGASVSDVTKRVVAVRLPLEVGELIRRKYRQEGDKSLSAPFVRALKEQTEGVRLTKADHDAIAAEMARNHKANQLRKIKYAKKHGTRTFAVV